MLLFGAGRLETTGQSTPYTLDNGQPSWLFFFSKSNVYNGFTTSDPRDHDDEGGMLGTTTNVSGPQFFKRKTVVMKGSRTQRYAPTAGGQDGFVAQTHVNWKRTLRPRR